MLHRDQAYRSILDQGMILGLPWGSDPIGDSTATMDDEDNDDNKEGKPSSDEGAEDGSHDQQEVGQ